MAKQIINPATLATPTGYSYAVKKAGLPVFIAGQVANDSVGQVVGEGNIEAQVEQVFENLKAVVEGCGGTMSDIVKITVFVTDLAYRPAVAAARSRYFEDGDFPASTFLVVSSLATPAYLVEIEAVAMIDQADQLATAKEAATKGAKNAKKLVEKGLSKAKSARRKKK